MPVMLPADSMFLIGESREHPMHVGGLQLFRKPAGAGPDYVGELYRELLTHTEVRRLLLRRPADPVSSLGQLWWTDERDIDLEYHVRLSALPQPGKVRQLLELVSRLHGSLLDRHRPMWEFHLIEGLEGDRFATYTKIHHSLVDGVAAMTLLAKTMSTDPEARGNPPVWAQRTGGRPSKAGVSKGVSELLTTAAKAVPAAVRDVAGVAGAATRLAGKAVRRDSAGLPFQAPATMLNVPITGGRRFAADSWPIERLRAVGQAVGATLNDVVLAMCSGALRRYLAEHDGLPDRSLVAAVPVSVRAEGAGGDGGNSIGMVLCPLASDLADPVARLVSIHRSMAETKQELSGLSPTQVQMLAATQALVPMLINVMPGSSHVVSPTFNLFISNVPGPRETLYWNGAELVGSYPVSIPFENQGLNITVTSYAGSMDFGLTGCRQTVPHLQRLLGYLEESLAELEKEILVD